MTSSSRKHPLPKKATSLVLFDIDGTLLCKAGAHHREALVAGIRRVAGLETTLEGVSTSGSLDRDLIRRMMQAAGANRRRIDALMKDVIAACQEHYAQSCAVDLRERLCPGVRDCLTRLQAHGVVLGLVTGNLTAIGWRKMELAGLRDLFSVGAFAEDGTSRARLARVAFQRAVRAGLVDRGCRVSLIGDHANDISAAKMNSFLSVAVASGLTAYEDLRQYQPDILVNDLSELDVALLI